MNFTLDATDGGARAGTLKLPHGVVQTPMFMPVGTQATVKTLSVDELKAMNADIILSNAYHLYLRPGIDVIRNAGGLHRFMNWDRNILTDSGGFQVFSLAELRNITEEGVTFKSHIDGSSHHLTPEKVMQIEHAIGADIIMALDVCIEAGVDREKTRYALELTTRWAERCRREVERLEIDNQFLFGIIQGGMFEDLRIESAEQLIDLDFPGYAIGGLSVGEEKSVMYAMLEALYPYLPVQKPHYLMGVGTPEDLLYTIERGVDLFDCVFPTRAARNGTAFTRTGRMILKNKQFEFDLAPIDKECNCETCRHYSRSYVRHLIRSGEVLGMRLLSRHNLQFLIDLARDARQAVLDKRYQSFKRSFLSRYQNGRFLNLADDFKE